MTICALVLLAAVFVGGCSADLTSDDPVRLDTSSVWSGATPTPTRTPVPPTPVPPTATPTPLPPTATPTAVPPTATPRVVLPTATPRIVTTPSLPLKVATRPPDRPTPRPEESSSGGWFGDLFSAKPQDSEAPESAPDAEDLAAAARPESIRPAEAPDSASPRRLDGAGGRAAAATPGSVRSAAAPDFASGAPAAKDDDVRSPRAVINDQRLRRVARERQGRPEAGEYRIGPEDLIEIVVFDVEELNRTVRVSSTGAIRLPLLGSIEAGGKTEGGLASDIAKRLESNFMHNPQVDVFVAEFRSQQVAVTGAVSNPGLYPLTRESYGLLDAIALAGGLTKDAGSIIEFIPASSDSRRRLRAATAVGADNADLAIDSGEAIQISLNDVVRGTGPSARDLLIEAGDVLHVPEAGFFTVEGWVAKPDTYPLHRESTVLAALSAAGGEVFPAKTSSVRILRTTQSGVREIISVNVNDIRDGDAADFPLEPGDVVQVSSVKSLLPVWALIETFRTILRFGASVPIL